MRAAQGQRSQKGWRGGRLARGRCCCPGTWAKPRSRKVFRKQNPAEIAGLGEGGAWSVRANCGGGRHPAGNSKGPLQRSRPLRGVWAGNETWSKIDAEYPPQLRDLANHLVTQVMGRGYQMSCRCYILIPRFSLASVATKEILNPHMRQEVIITTPFAFRPVVGCIICFILQIWTAFKEI